MYDTKWNDTFFAGLGVRVSGCALCNSIQYASVCLMEMVTNFVTTNQQTVQRHK